MQNSSISTEPITINHLLLLRKRSFSKRLFSLLQNIFTTYREQIQFSLTVFGVGTIFLGSIFFFFVQLAEFGW